MDHRRHQARTRQLRTHGPDGTFAEDGSLSIARQTLRSVSMRMLGCLREAETFAERSNGERISVLKTKFNGTGRLLNLYQNCAGPPTWRSFLPDFGSSFPAPAGAVSLAPFAG
jgi:hypothetical protein